MADDQASSNEINDGVDPQELSYDDETTTAFVADTKFVETTAAPADDYVEEPIEDYVVNLVVNEQQGSETVSPDLVDAALTDMQGNIIHSKTSAVVDSINGYTTTVFNELSDGSAANDGKRWWGWSTQKMVIVGLIALCILAIILVVIFLIIGKKFKKNRSETAGAAKSSKTTVAKGVSQDPKYQPVPNV